MGEIPTNLIILYWIIKVGLDDQLRFVSLAKGTDLKYVLLRLQKAVSRIEEALKVLN